MTNGEIDVRRLLEEAASAALGPRPWLETPSPEVPEDSSAEESPARGQGVAESPMGWLAPSWTQLTPQGAAEARGGGVSKAVGWLNPLVGGLLGLFGSREQAAEAGPVKAQRPAGIHYEAGFAGAGGELVEIDRDEKGQARAAAQAPQVVVNIEAVDSQSFLDRTPQIAEAVKRALLESEGLGRLMGGE